MSRRRPHYPGLDDPRAALEKLREVDLYVLGLQRQFYIATPAYEVLSGIRTALREAALTLTGDRYFFGGGGGGQSPYKPPPAPPVPGK